MKILVFGAGAVGSTIGGMLARMENDVVLIGRNPHMSRITNSGLKISGLWGDHHVKMIRGMTELPSDFSPDLILLTTKAYATEASAQLLARAYPQPIPILHLQNGVGNAEKIAEHVGWDRVISGMVIIGFQVALAGRTVVTVQADSIKIGRSNGDIDPIVEKIASTFADAGMPAEAVSNIQTHLWGKVLYNSALNPLAAILGVPYGRLLDEYPWQIIQGVIQEAFAVLNAEKQSLFWENADQYLIHLKNVQIPSTFEHKPSMLSDLRHARPTEIDVLNGALVQLGKKWGIPTPVNGTLLEIIHSFEENGKRGILHPSLQMGGGEAS